MDSANQGQSWKPEPREFDYLVKIQEIVLEYNKKKGKLNPKEVLRRIGLIFERWNPDVVKMQGNYLVGKEEV